MVPCVRLQTHSMKEKPHFPYITEPGEPSSDEGVAAFPPKPSCLPGPRSAASQPWALHNTLCCCLCEGSLWDCLCLLFSVTKIVSLAWGKYKVEMLIIYFSGLLLKRDVIAVWGQSLLCHVCVSSLSWVLQRLSTSSIFCNLCRISLSAGFCLKPSSTITNFPKHSLCLCLWFTFPSFSSYISSFSRQVKHLLLNAEQSDNGWLCFLRKSSTQGNYLF